MTCKAISCNAMTCNAMTCYAMMCNAMMCNAMTCNAMTSNAMPCNAMTCNTMSYTAMTCNAMICNDMQCNDMQCNSIACHCTMRSLEMTSGDLETTSQFGPWKLIPGNKCGRVARGYSNCWRLQRLLEAATGCRWGPQYDGKCSFYFNCYFFSTTRTKEDLRLKAVYFPAWMCISLML